MPRIRLNGITVNYRDQGQGEALFMVHNLTSNIAGFDRIFPELSKHYRVVAADLRGHGHTTHEEDEEKAKSFYTFENLANDQLALLDELGIDRFYLFGQAYWGANTALHLFDKIPDRVKSMVISSSSMIISDDTRKPYDVLGEAGRNNFLRMFELARNEGMMAVYHDRLEYGQFWGPSVLGSPEILREFVLAHELTSAAAFVTIPHLTEQTRDAIATRLRECAVPLLLLVGEDENENNRQYFINEMRKDYPAAWVLVLARSGHYPTIENPADFSRTLVNFYAGADSNT